MIPGDASKARRYLVRAGQGGVRIDRFLKERLPELSRREIAFWIQEQGVLRNGRPVRKGAILHEGDQVDLRIPFGPSGSGVVPEPKLPLTVLWEDPLFVALDKAPGMPAHPLHVGEKGTVVNGLIARYPEMEGVGFSLREPGLLHRLDRDTSGVLLAARRPFAFERLRGEFEQGRVDKIYLAVVQGRPEPQGEVLFPLASKSRGAKRVEVARDPLSARRLRACAPAETYFRVIRFYRDFAFVRLRMRTGARHQLRAHMAFLGHPVVGDSLYGSGSQTMPESTGPARHLLHAAELRFFHPSDGRPIRIRAPLPADIRSFLKGLAKR
jgi:23S rRNA pseudouridine1911/1915/1917 synthase